MPGEVPESRRERKKRATRDAIAATARLLFAERGFDAVTVAQVAAAADVSEKTVFNHFATKEDLAFGGRYGRLEQLYADIRQRPPGTSVLDLFREKNDAMLDALAAGGADFIALSQVIGSSRALRERLTGGWEDELAALTSVIAETAGAEDADIVPGIVARALSWIYGTTMNAALAALQAGEDPELLAARLRVAADRAYDQLTAGLGDYGRAG